MKRTQGFDNNTREHVIWFEYRVRVSDDAPPPIPDEQKAREAHKMAYLRKVAADFAAARSSQEKNRFSTVPTIPQIGQHGQPGA